MSQCTGESDFYGTETYADAETLLRYGVPEVEQKIREISAEFSGLVGSSVSALASVYAEIGDDVDVSGFLSGEPEHMLSTVEIERPGTRIITLLVQGAMLSRVRPEQVLRRGAAIASLCDLLENSGYRLEIVYMASSQTHVIDHVCVSFPIKKAGEHLDITRLSYLLCHASAFRRHIWKWRETLAAELRSKLDWNDVTASRTDDYAACLIPHDLFIGSQEYESYFSSDERAKGWVMDTLRKLNALT